MELNSTNLLEHVRTTLKKVNLEPYHLKLELAESILYAGCGITGGVSHALAESGVKLVIDNFVTGFSSLSYLRQRPIGTLKIDQSFVSRMIGSPDDVAIVSAAINMGKNSSSAPLRQAWKTQELHALLWLRIATGKGYYFGRPVAAETFGTLRQTGIPSTTHI